MIPPYIASDYAGMTGGGVSFYFGYEETTAEEEWCFVAREEGKEPFCVPQSQLEVKDRWDVAANLLAGIGKWLDQRHPAASSEGEKK